METKKLIIIISLLIITAASLIIIISISRMGLPKMKLPWPKEKTREETFIIKTFSPPHWLSAKAAYALGLSEAKKWQGDAKLSFLQSNDDLALSGQSPNWDLEFVSLADKDHYFGVVIVEGKITETLINKTKMPLFVADLPNQWLDSHKVIAKVRAMPEYRNKSPFQISLIYKTHKSSLKDWYWGIWYWQGNNLEEKITFPIF